MPQRDKAVVAPLAAAEDVVTVAAAGTSTAAGAGTAADVGTTAAAGTSTAAGASTTAGASTAASASMTAGVSKSSGDDKDFIVEDARASTTSHESALHEFIASWGEHYDPHLHRQVHNPTNNIETLIHLIKSSLGTGLLAMPQAYSRSGVIVGVVGTFAVAYLLTYCMHTLIAVQYTLCKRERVALLEYADAAELAFRDGPKCLRPLSPHAPIIVNTFIIVHQLGIGCGYIVFIADNLKAIVDQQVVLDRIVVMCIIMAPLLVFNLIRSLRVLVPFTAVANLLTLVAVIVMFYDLFQQPSVEEDIKWWGKAAEYPFYIGTTLFSLAAVGVVVALENNMKSPKAFIKPCGVLNLGMGFVATLYVTLGLVGYIKCRSQCKDYVTLNLPLDAFSKVTRTLMTVAMFISYVLQCNVPMDIVWRFYVRPRLEARGVQRLLLAENIMRCLLCLFTFVMAVLVPGLQLFFALFGSMCLSVLGIAFPALLQACLLHMRGCSWGLCRWRLLRAVLLLALAVLAFITGVYSAIWAIVNKFYLIFTSCKTDITYKYFHAK